ncbi:hypothetical protein EsDP_00004029 [Epichloe bromicola]|uniref:DUF6604 domain-containing protein n=1 Tax=Epichloe bromicola TaxID=79588 RepID=A0ABQ0CQH8_9HYPO
MLLRGSYLAYKRETSRLVYLLVTASNAVLSVKNFKVRLNTTGKIDSSGFVPAAELIAKHMKSIPCEILRLLKSVIELRISHYAEFQRLVSTNPNFEMEESNKSHKHFIDVLSRTFQILGGEDGLKKEKKAEVKADKKELSNEDFQATFSNLFEHLDLQSVQDSDEESDDTSLCCGDGEISRTDCAKKALLSKRAKADRNGKNKRNGKNSRGKPSSKNKKKSPGKVPLEQYGIMDDDHHVAAEHFLVASSILEQCIDLRLQSQKRWWSVAYSDFHPLTALSTSAQSIAMIQRAHKTISLDFPGSHSYKSLINTYTRGGMENLQPTTTIRVYRDRDSDECCVSMQETAVSREPMRELLMEHAYNNLVEFLEDYGMTPSGAPTKSMQAEISQWDPEYDLEAATDDQRLEWRRLYTINWLYGLAGYYLSTKQEVDEEGTRASLKTGRKISTPWADSYTFFGLGDFARSIISLARKTSRSQVQDCIPPHLVFQVQCIVDSFTASRGWEVEVSGHILKAPPVKEGLPEKCGMIGWFNRVTCANECGHHQGLSQAIQSLSKLYASSETRHCAFGRDSLELVWKSWWEHHHTIIELRNGEAPGPRVNGRVGRLDEYGLFSFSPFLCSFAMLQTIELFYRYAMFVWDSTPEIILILHLHNMLSRTGALKEPVELMDKVTSWFSRDLFGETRPTSNFRQAFLDRKGALRFTSLSLLQPFLIGMPSYKQFHMSERFFKTRSSFLVFHEAGWEADAVSPLRVSNLSRSSWLRIAIKALKNRSPFDSRKHFTKIPKSGHDIDLPHFDPTSEHIPETMVLDQSNYSLERDICACCQAPLSGVNFLAVTHRLLSMWIAIEEKLKHSGHVPSDGVDRTASSSRRSPIESVLLTALQGDDDELNQLMAEVFDENRGGSISSVAYFTGSAGPEEDDAGEEDAGSV